MSDSKTQKRFCPKCGQGVRGNPATFENRVKCPKCEQNVLFYDYPRAEKVPIPDGYESTFYYVTAAIGGLLVLLLIILPIVIVAGKTTALALVSLLAFAIGIIGFGFAAHRHDRANRLEHYEERYEFAVQSLYDAVELANGYRRNYESVLNEGLAEVRQLKIEAEEEIRFQKVEAALHGEAVQTVTDKFVDETCKWSLKSVNPNNYHQIWKRVQRNIDWCTKRGGQVTKAQIKAAKSELEQAYRDAVAKAEAKEEQRAIREQMREEAKVERQLKRALDEAAARERAIEKAIKEAIAKTHDEHSAEVEELRRQLAEAHENTIRTKSRAEMTRAGHVYVISNIGSFGENVFKVGMTRRLEPMDRVTELGDASVPFPFDVHAMISSNDAPTLEKALHRELDVHRVNRVNHRKEFFRVDLPTIIKLVEQNHGEVDYVAVPEALQHRESLEIESEVPNDDLLAEA